VRLVQAHHAHLALPEVQVDALQVDFRVRHRHSGAQPGLFTLGKAMTTRVITKEAFLGLVHDAGGVTRVSEILSVSRQRIYQWSEARVPAERVPEVANVLGVGREVLRPDIFGEG